MTSSRPVPGTVITAQWRKWDGSPHWRHDSVYLGSDEWGDWIGQPVGWHSERPGASYDTDAPNVTLIPASGDNAVTIFRGHPRALRVYIDLGWDVRWNAADPSVTGIDMDLDVVRRTDASGTYVDDRDEWADHSARFGYPADVMEHLENLALDLEVAVREEQAPFDAATGDAWLDRLEALNLSR